MLSNRIANNAVAKYLGPLIGLLLSIKVSLVHPLGKVFLVLFFYGFLEVII